MKKLFTVIILVMVGLVPAAVQAQAPAKVDTTSTTIAPPGIVLGNTVAPSAVAKPAAPATATAVAPGTPPPLALSPVTPAADPNALKVKAEVNPMTGALTVRTDAPGPTRVEVNDVSGRPVITKNVMVGNKPVILDVKRLPAGSYVVRCTAGEKTGIRRVLLGQ